MTYQQFHLKRRPWRRGHKKIRILNLPGDGATEEMLSTRRLKEGTEVSSDMAASRMGRVCLRYRLFFYAAVFLIAMQLFLAWNFYAFNLEEMKKSEELKRRLDILESKHKVC